MCISHSRSLAVGVRGHLGRKSVCGMHCRLSSPVALKYFLLWLELDAAGVGGGEWRGWMLALAVTAGGVGMTLVHHQFFW